MIDYLFRNLEFQYLKTLFLKLNNPFEFPRCAKKLKWLFCFEKLALIMILKYL